MGQTGRSIETRTKAHHCHITVSTSRKIGGGRHMFSHKHVIKFQGTRILSYPSIWPDLSGRRFSWRSTLTVNGLILSGSWKPLFRLLHKAYGPISSGDCFWGPIPLLPSHAVTTVPFLIDDLRYSSCWTLLPLLPSWALKTFLIF